MISALDATNYDLLIMDAFLMMCCLPRTRFSNFEQSQTGQRSSSFPT